MRSMRLAATSSVVNLALWSRPPMAAMPLWLKYSCSSATRPSRPSMTVMRFD